MKKITRFLFCIFVAIMLMGTAISATACHQKEEYPSVPEVTEPQPTGEIIPTVDRQKELKAAKKNNSSAVQGGSVVVSYKPGGDSGDRGVQLYRLQGCKDVQGHGGCVRHFLFLARTAPDVTAEQVLESRAWHDVINGIGLTSEQ